MQLRQHKMIENSGLYSVYTYYDNIHIKVQIGTNNKDDKVEQFSKVLTQNQEKVKHIYLAH